MMLISNPRLTVNLSKVEGLAAQLSALSNKDAQLVSDVLSLTNKDVELIAKDTELADKDAQLTTITDQLAAKDIELQASITANTASRANLLINPRGKINQLAEPQGVIEAGDYFCDGWKAGDNGAEVYVDSDGFRLVSGSIVQLVPNSLEVGQTIRSALDVVSGVPQMSINGGSDNENADDGEYIRFEVSGDNSKFTRLVLAQSEQPPLYVQERDEMAPCLRFLVVNKETLRRPFCVYASGYAMVHILDFPQRMHKVPAVNIWISSAASSIGTGWSEISDRVQASRDGMTAIIRNGTMYDHQVAYVAVNHIVADARP